MLAILAGGTIICAAPSSLLHEASGLRFPDSIEGKWQRQAHPQFGKTAAVEYQSVNGWMVQILVNPASVGAHGPTKQDGDANSDATPEILDVEITAEMRALFREMLGAPDYNAA